MLTLLNIGNSNTQMAEVDASGVIGKPRTLPTSELTAGEIPPGPVAAASVVREACTRLPEGTFFLNGQTAALDLTAVDASTLGADRIANALEARSRGLLPAAVVDCGTAITFEIVDGDGAFRGGAILPGRRLQREALHDKTSQLPILEWRQTAPLHAGTDTRSAMYLGIDRGAVGAVREILTLLQKDYPGIVFWCVGGDRALFLENLPELRDGGECFTLSGVLQAWRLAQSDAAIR